MSGFWKGYANVNDDVRHTYEQVFFGRQTTGNLTENDIPGMRPEQGQAAPMQAAPDAGTGTTGPGVAQEGPQAETAAHSHAEFYGSVWGTAPPGGAPEATDALGRYHAPVLDQQAGGIHGPAALEPPTIEGTATPIEAPRIEPPSQGNDMTPGY